MKNTFNLPQFVATEHSTAEEKVKFANHFVHFVLGGFLESQFYQWFYERLAMTFGHIAHCDRAGFYSTWFALPQRQLSFLKRIATCPLVGDPEFTYVDVERALKEWLLFNAVLIKGLEARVQAATIAGELATLKKLAQRHGYALVKLEPGKGGET